MTEAPLSGVLERRVRQLYHQEAPHQTESSECRAMSTPFDRGAGRGCHPRAWLWSWLTSHLVLSQNLPALVLKIMSGTFTPISDRYSPELRQLVLSLLSLEPSQRPPLSHIMAQPLCIRALLNLHTDLGSVRMRRPVQGGREALGPGGTQWEHDKPGAEGASGKSSIPACGRARNGPGLEVPPTI